MKYIAIFALGMFLFSCGTKVPYTEKLKEEYALDATQNIKRVQFYVSSTIIIQKEKKSGGTGTSNDGTLVSNSNKEQERIIIAPNTKCVFEKFGETGEIFVRFEVGDGKYLKFAVRQNQRSDKFYFVANWDQGKANTVEYGNDVYTATAESGSAYLMVVLKKLNKTKRKDRIVKGMKV